MNNNSLISLTKSTFNFYEEKYILKVLSSSLENMIEICDEEDNIRFSFINQIYKKFLNIKNTSLFDLEFRQSFTNYELHTLLLHLNTYEFNKDDHDTYLSTVDKINNILRIF